MGVVAKQDTVSKWRLSIGRVDDLAATGLERPKDFVD